MSGTDAQIKSDPPAAPKPGTPEYDAAMIEKAAGSTMAVVENGQRIEIDLSPAPGDKKAAAPAAAPPSTDGKPQRPEWCPEKFWNADTGTVNTEAMAKSYGELERGKGKAPLADPTKQQKAPAASPPAPAADATKAVNDAIDAVLAAQAKLAAATTDADKAAAQTALDAARKAVTESVQAPPVPASVTPELLQKADAEFRADGKLSDETFASLEKAGVPRSYAEAYIEGLQSKAEVVTNKVYAEAGGKEQYEAVKEWAATNLTAEEIEAANAAFSSGDLTAVIGQVRALTERYNTAMGSPGKLRDGAGGSVRSGAEPFRSGAEVSAAMSKPEYRNDPAYRANVEARIAAAMKAGIELGF